MFKRTEFDIPARIALALWTGSYGALVAFLCYFAFTTG